MYYTEPNRKQEFTAKYKQQEKVYQIFVTAMKAIIPVINQYDGKVINVRLVKSAKEVVKDVYISLSDDKINLSVDAHTKMYKSVSGTYSNIDVYHYEFTISKDENNRLDSANTIVSINSEIEYLISEITAILNDISFYYDKEIEAYAELKKAIQEYKDAYTSRLQRHITIN